MQPECWLIAVGVAFAIAFACTAARSEVLHVERDEVALDRHAAWPHGIGEPNTPGGFTSMGTHGTGRHCGAPYWSREYLDTNCEPLFYVFQQDDLQWPRLRKGNIDLAPLGPHGTNQYGPCGYSPQNYSTTGGALWQEIPWDQSTISDPPLGNLDDPSVCWADGKDLQAGLMYWDGIYSGGIGDEGYGEYGWGPLYLVLAEPAEALTFKVKTVACDLSTPGALCDRHFNQGGNKTLRVRAWQEGGFNGFNDLDGVYTFFTGDKPDGTGIYGLLRFIGEGWTISLAVPSGEPPIVALLIDSPDGSYVRLGTDMLDTLLFSTGTWSDEGELGQEPIVAVPAAGIGGRFGARIHYSPSSSGHAHQVIAGLNKNRRPSGRYQPKCIVDPARSPGTCTSFLRSDFDDDGVIGLADFGRLAACFNQPSSGACALPDVPEFDAFAPFPHGDGTVTIVDFGKLAQDFGQACSYGTGNAETDCDFYDY